MCLLVLAWRVHPRYRLIVAANRDEYHERPTAPLAQVAGAERHPRRAGPARRRHLARRRSPPPLRRGHEFPRAAAAAALGAVARRAGPGLPGAGGAARGNSSPAWRRMRPATPASICCSATRDAAVVRLEPAGPVRAPAAARGLRAQQRVSRHARGPNCAACASASRPGSARRADRSGARSCSRCSADRSPPPEGPPQPACRRSGSAHCLLLSSYTRLMEHGAPPCCCSSPRARLSWPNAASIRRAMRAAKLNFS